MPLDGEKEIIERLARLETELGRLIQHVDVERLARLETDIQWIKAEIREVKKSTEKYRWWILTGFVFVVALQILVRLMLG